MKTFFILFFILFISCNRKRNDVYICISPEAERFHYDSTCYGFDRCTHERHSVTITEAKERGYTECRIED